MLFTSKFRFDILKQVYHAHPQKYTPAPLSYAVLRTVYIYKSKAWGCTDMQTSPLILTALAGLSTGLGGVLAVLGKPTEKLLAASAGFAGGVMLTASLTDLLPEALDFYAAYLPSLGSGGAVVSLLAMGMLTAALLGRLLPEESELADRFGQGRDPARAAAMRTALITGAALLLHNFPEGVLTFFAGTADPALGLRTAAAIALHNIPEGLAVALPFAYATRSRVAGVLAALVSGLAEPLGAVLAWLFLRRFFTPGFLTGTVVLAAGIMVWVALAQLLPQAMAAKHRAAGIFGAAAGTLLMLLGIAALP